MNYIFNALILSACFLFFNSRIFLFNVLYIIEYSGKFLGNLINLENIKFIQIKYYQILQATKEICYFQILTGLCLNLEPTAFMPAISSSIFG